MKDELREIGAGIGYNYSAVMLAQFLSMPLSLFYLSIITKNLGADKFGNFTIFLATAQLFFCIFSSWTRDSIIRFGSEVFSNDKEFGKIIGSQLIITSSSLLAALVILFLLKNYLQGIVHLGGNSFLWVAAYLSAYIFYDFILKFVQARHKLRSYALALFFRQISLVFSLYFLFGILKKTITIKSVLVIEIISYLFLFILFFKPGLSHKKFFPFLSCSKKMVFTMLRYIWPVFIAVFLGYGTIWADTWMIKFFLSFKSVGEYEAVNRLIQMAVNTIMPISVIGFPLMVSLRNIGSNSIINIFATKIVAQLCFFWTFVIITLVLCSKIIIYFVYGKDFISSLFAFQVLLAGVSFQVLPILYTSILQAYDKTKKMALIAGISLIINLFLDIILIPRYGIIGAASSKACMLIACALLYERSALSCLQIKKINYVIYFILSIPSIALLALYVLKASVFVLLFFLIVLYWFTIVIVKRTGIFSQDGWSFWEKVKMPVFVTVAFRKIYGALS